MQLDEAERGFSFQEDGPLDMRMDPESGASAADVVNSLPARELAQVIRVLGEEKRAGSIARAIVRARDREAITRTGALAEIVSGAVGGRRGERKHPATRTFQALRIYVNRELEELAEGLNAAERVLSAGGRLVIVAFHSLEDRMVKRFIAATSGQGRSASRHMPLPVDGPLPSFVELHHGGVAPGDDEIEANPRARSARMRAAERTGAPALQVDAHELGLPRLTPLPEPREGGWQ
jgi:16S rRNA (cytosine1402-N4)-methyltransferase